MVDRQLEIHFGNGLNIERSEKALLTLANAVSSGVEEIRLNLSACQHIDSGAGWRLGNALRYYSELVKMEIAVPPVSSPKDFQGAWFLNFTRSGLGHSIALRARSIISEERDITEMVNSYYSESVRSSSQNHIIIRNLESSINCNNYDSFLLELYRCLPYVGVVSGMYEARALNNLGRLTYEAIQNVYDHAGRSPFVGASSVMSHFSLAYYKNIENPKYLSPNFLEYRSRIRGILDWTTDFQGFVELVVNDDGNGIAARFSQDSRIYWKEVSLEENALLGAFREGSSVKLLAGDSPLRGDPGFGSEKMLAALKSLSAFCEIRTGRKQAIYDSTVESVGGLSLLSEVLGYMPGSALHIIIPRRRIQPNLPLV
jgi:hypothetical protein